MPTVSVVIPAYNRARVLPRAIQSVLDQTRTDLEVIVVDDNSSDDTETVVGRFDDERVSYVRHETNQGGSGARNTGIDATDGEYVAFLDSDDVFHPRKLERQVAELESRGDEWVAAYCGVDYRVPPTSRPVQLFERGLRAVLEPFAPSLFEGYAGMGREGGAELVGPVIKMEFSVGGSSTLLVERDTLEAMDGWDATFQRQQDLEFLVRLLRQGKLAYVDETLVTKYEWPGPSYDVVVRERERFLRTFADEIVAMELQGENVVGAHRFAIALSYFNAGDMDAGWRYLRRSRPASLADYYALVPAVVAGLRARE